ncbi:acyl-ACP--UDP-N-acetylglucosamine O-acyltransferase [Campylobacter sp.]|uniref:acyl-ACP--UDP-N-acetylglucosamine O-acyltransferase n=1 Tax=Campylobacter sp. TaxID=205 RepID=UPI002AA8C2B4|nr:acyl-ACP--UDP-N-acetylglucosamine O-acyltransferase [Campylobacter sp.]MCI6565097.1 acyl-ACP--UDP-N-acetylglucosamine O-acyltransferase [Campylobacter sp.]MCI6579854.1 acyl-ACP--UDP-N-acetylglucosamine O-acyltransferase [Campylobacter sp.]
MISDKAIVEKGAKLGFGVVIEPFAYVGSGVELGDNCVVKSGAKLVGNTKIGENSKIYSYAIIGEACQDIGHKPSGAESVIIGKNSVIREFATINSGTFKNENCDGSTKIGDNAFIMAYCHIAHDCKVGNNIIFANNATLAGHVEIGDFTVVGGLTPIHQFVRIGEGCMIAGASGVSQDIVPFCLAEGNRAYIRGLNVVGLRRRFNKVVIDEIHSAFRKLQKAHDIKEIAAQLTNHDCEQVRKMAEFILNTTRGIPMHKGKE